MNYSIQFETCSYPYLEVTPRKRTTKHSLIKVDNGMALFKLGKQEYAVEAGQAIWVPLECLCSVSFFPNTQISRVDFSVRLRDRFPHQAGFITLSDLSLALLTRLAKCQPNEEVYTHLLQVLKDEVKSVEPELIENALSQQLTQWNPNLSDACTKEQHIVLLVREAMKRKLSGKKPQIIIDELFAGNTEQFEQMCHLVLGRNL